MYTHILSTPHTQVCMHSIYIYCTNVQYNKAQVPPLLSISESLGSQYREAKYHITAHYKNLILLKGHFTIYKRRSSVCTAQPFQITHTNTLEGFFKFSNDGWPQPLKGAIDWYIAIPTLISRETVPLMRKWKLLIVFFVFISGYGLIYAKYRNNYNETFVLSSHHLALLFYWNKKLILQATIPTLLQLLAWTALCLRPWMKTALPSSIKST